VLADWHKTHFGCDERQRQLLLRHQICVAVSFQDLQQERNSILNRGILAVFVVRFTIWDFTQDFSFGIMKLSLNCIEHQKIIDFLLPRKEKTLLFFIPLALKNGCTAG